MNATAFDERDALQAGIDGRLRVLERQLTDFVAAGAPFAQVLLTELQGLASPPVPRTIGSALRFRDGKRPSCSLEVLEVILAQLAALERRVVLLALPPERLRLALTPARTVTPRPDATLPEPVASILEPAATLPEPAASEELSPSERRGEFRATMKTAVTLDSGSNFFIGFTRNISRGGLFLACEDPMRCGTAVELVFTLPGGRRIEASAEVSWVRERMACGPEIHPGMGLRFMHLKEADRRAIRTFMRLREPLFYPE